MRDSRALGPKLPDRDVGCTVATGEKPDVTRTAQFGRERPEAVIVPTVEEP